MRSRRRQGQGRWVVCRRKAVRGRRDLVEKGVGGEERSGARRRREEEGRSC